MRTRLIMTLICLATLLVELTLDASTPFVRTGTAPVAQRLLVVGDSAGDSAHETQAFSPMSENCPLPLDNLLKSSPPTHAANPAVDFTWQPVLFEARADGFTVDDYLAPFQSPHHRPPIS